MTTKTDPIALVRIVDDDPELLKSAAFLIRMAGYDVLTYESAASFLALDDGLRPGCIILDQRMPGMTGLELQEALLEKGSTTPIIFLSAHGDIPMAMQAVHRGAMDFLVKPADPEVLVAAVKKAVEKSIAEAQAADETEKVQNFVESLTERELEVARQILLRHRRFPEHQGDDSARPRIHDQRVDDRFDSPVAQITHIDDPVLSHKTGSLCECIALLVPETLAPEVVVQPELLHTFLQFRVVLQRCAVDLSDPFNQRRVHRARPVFSGSHTFDPPLGGPCAAAAGAVSGSGSRCRIRCRIRCRCRSGYPGGEFSCRLERFR